MSETTTSTTWRFNWRAAATLAILAAILGVSVLVLLLTGPGRVGEAARSEIDRLVEEGRPDLALRHLGRYLEQQPDDAEMLFLQARLLADRIERSPDQMTLEVASRLHDRLLRQFPDHPDEDELRARLAWFYILLSDAYERDFNQMADPEQATLKSRYRAAAQIVEELIPPEGSEEWDDTPAHYFYLKGRAMDGLAVNSGLGELGNAITSYENALDRFERQLLELEADLAEAEAALIRAEADLAEAAENEAPEDETDALAKTVSAASEAVSEASEAVEETSQEMADAVVRLARLHRDSKKDPEEVERWLDRLIEARPEDVKLRLAGYAYFREIYDERRAAEELRTALELAPEDLGVRLVAAQHALHRGDPATAKTYLMQASKGDEQGIDAEDQAKLSLVDGMIEFAEDDRFTAVDRWQSALVGVQGSDEQLAWWLSYVRIRLGHLEDARDPMGRYLTLSGSNRDGPRFRLLLALLFEQQGNYTAAISELEPLSRNNRVVGEVKSEATFALGRCYEALGDRELAMRILDRAALGDDQPIAPVAAKARMLRRAGRHQEAARVLERVLEQRAPDNPEFWMMLVAARLAEQAALPPRERSWRDFDRAVEGAREAIKVTAQAEGINDPRSVELTLRLADREVLEGRLDQADAEIQEALEHSPAIAPLWVYRAELMLNSGQPSQALRMVERGREAAGDDVRLRLVEARILLSMGRGREAQDRLLRGIARLEEEEQATLREALGRLRLAQANFDGAAREFREWEDVDPGPGPILAQIDVALARASTPDQVDEVRKLLDRLLLDQEDLQDFFGDRLELPSSKDGLSYRMAEARILLREAELMSPAPVEDGDPSQTDPRLSLLEEAEKLINGAEGVLEDAEELASAHLLLGRIQEAKGDLTEAVESFETAWERGLSQALPPLTDLLARLEEFDRLEELAKQSEANPGIGQLSTQALMGAGQVDQASRMLAEAGDNSDSPDALASWRARMLSMAGRQDELEGLLRRQAEQAGPDQATPWIDLVAAQARFGRDRSALEVTIQRALDRATAVPSASLEARLRLASGDPEGADAALRTALEEPVVDPSLLIDAASYYNETGRPERAEPLLERLTAADPRSKAALDLAMSLSSRASQDPEAWQRAMELVGPDDDGDSQGEEDLDRRLARAIVLSRAPDPARQAEAVPRFEALMDDLPPMVHAAVEARKQLAALLIRLGQFDQASQVTAVSARQPSSSPEAIALHARALLAAGRPIEAGEELDRLERLRPADAEAAELRVVQILAAGPGSPEPLERAARDRVGSPGGDLFGRAACLKLLAIGSPEALEAAGRIAERVVETSPRLLWLSGLVSAVRVQPEEALRRCADAVATVDLNDRTDRLGLADAVLRAVQAVPIARRADVVERARPIVEEMLGRRPGDPDLLITSAVLSHQAGRYQDEAEAYRQALLRRPGDSMARYNLALVLSEGLDRPEEALEQLDLVAARIGSTAAVLGARGVILTRLGSLDEAIQALRRSIELEPTADRHYYLARAYHKAGRDDRFRAQLEQARQAGLDPDAIDPWQQDELQRLLSL